MSDVTYTWYAETYGGDLPEEAYAGALPAAIRHVAWICGNREPSEDEGDAYNRAICAAVDVFATYGEGQVGGFTIGDFKMGSYDDVTTTGEQMTTDAVVKELRGTTLLFNGVR